MDLFVDGTFARTLTNIPPSLNNSLNVTIRGRLMTYRVPAGATIQSAAAGLTAVLNTTSNTNVTKVRAFAHGDRIELQSLDLSQPGAQIPISAGSPASTAPALTTFLAASRTNFLDTIAFGLRTFAVFSTAFSTPPVGSYLQLSVTKTNGTKVTVAITNNVSDTTISTLTQGLVNLIDATPALQGTDGVAAEDFLNYDANVPPAAQFNLRALSAGWNAAQLQVAFSSSSTLTPNPPARRGSIRTWLISSRATTSTSPPGQPTSH